MSSCFTNVLLLAIGASYVIDDIGRGVCEVISDLNESLATFLKASTFESFMQWTDMFVFSWLLLIDVICDQSLQNIAWNLFVKSGQVGIDRHQAFFVIHSF